jgi:hypothetical protein
MSQGHLLWMDNLQAVIKLETLSLGWELIKPTGHCACLNLLQTCQADGEVDCDKKTSECNRMLDWGGQFCLPNKWGGNNCYEH